MPFDNYKSEELTGKFVVGEGAMREKPQNLMMIKRAISCKNKYKHIL